MKAYMLLLFSLLLSPVAESHNRCDCICEGLGKYECDTQIEKHVSERVPGVILRSGFTLELTAKNGVKVTRVSDDPKLIDGHGFSISWACNYFPKSNIVEICYRLWEERKSEFFNVVDGSVVEILGGYKRLPYGKHLVFVDGHQDVTSKIEIWVLTASGIKREFHLKPNWEYWVNPIWATGSEVILYTSELIRQPAKVFSLRFNGEEWLLKELSAE